MIICCAGCEKPILDKFLLTVLDRTWHSDCVRCNDCGIELCEKCYSREGKLFCRTDFFKRFGTKCSGCLQGISPQDLVRKARDRVFHLKCFTCCICRKQLSTGEELYVLDENKFICKHDYVNGKSMADSFGVPSDDEEEALDIKPNIDPTTPIPTPPTSITPNMTTSPAGGGHISCPNLLRTVVTPPTQNSLDSASIGPPSASSLAGLIGRSTSPSSVGMTNVNNATPNSLHDSMGVNFRDTPPSERDGSSTFPDSDVSDGECSNETKDPNSADCSKLTDDDKASNKRRGPRTTIKAKQLEVLKSAFASTPKPTRHIREQLAKDTGLPMRVIQVWFQNKRSKERRMKQLSSMGMRAHLFGNPRKLRGMRMSPSMEDGYPYYADPFGYGPQNFHDFFPGHGPHPPPGMGFPHGLPPAMEQPLPPGGPMGDFSSLGPGLSGTPLCDSPYLSSQQQEMLSQRSSPEMGMNHAVSEFCNAALFHAHQFGPAMHHEND